ncbi:MAG: insulinase family protein, partial [Oscillospiraceae bacterium]|nr:insulinase family protein [Oscillospiraceae bacterium]
RIKKAAFGRQLRLLNSFDGLCYQYASGYFRGYDAHRAAELLLAVTEDDVSAFIRENLKPENMAISIVTPKTEVAV